MRTFDADVVNSSFKLQAPFTMLISGSSGSGKTTFIENILRYNKIDSKPKTIYYHYPPELTSIPVKWHSMFESLNVKYIQGLPDECEWNSVKPNSLVIIDDLYVECVNNEAAAKAFKIYSKKRNFSIILVSQFFFDRGPYSSTIRNNIEYFTLFENHGNMSMNRMIAEKLGYMKRFKEAAHYAFNKRHGYVLISVSSKVYNSKLRVCCNFFGENDFYPSFFI